MRSIILTDRFIFLSILVWAALYLRAGGWRSNGLAIGLASTLRIGIVLAWLTSVISLANAIKLSLPYNILNLNVFVCERSELEGGQLDSVTNIIMTLSLGIWARKRWEWGTKFRIFMTFELGYLGKMNCVAGGADWSRASCCYRGLFLKELECRKSWSRDRISLLLLFGSCSSTSKFWNSLDT